MSCLRCGVEFGLFKRETYCRNCGFSFCNSCLNKKCSVPKLGTDGKHAVCQKCFTLLTSGSSGLNANSNKMTTFIPPAKHQKRMELLENKHGFCSNANGCSSDVIKDKMLAERLEKLRSERLSESPPSFPQLEERLARLKGTCVSSSRQMAYAKPDTRTSTECSQDLFNQIAEEVKLESTLPDPDEEIRLRLEKLRNDDAVLNDLNKPSVNGGEFMRPSVIFAEPTRSDEAFVNPDMQQVLKYMMDAEKEALKEAEEAIKLQEKDIELKQKLHEIRSNRDIIKCHRETKISNGDLSDEDNEDKIVDKVIQQFLSETRLENSIGTCTSQGVLRNERNDSCFNQKEKKLINSSDTDDTDLEELPWCVICNSNANLRCYGCDGDLYCRRCFRECHDAFELRDHPSATFITN